MTVMVGGFATVNHSMPIIRQIIRQGTKNLTVIGSATAGLEVDLLIGAGAVRKVIAPYVGAELFCPIGHCFRRAAERGDIEIYETSEYLLYAGLYARSMGIGFMPWRGGIGTSIPKLNPALREFKDPIYGETYLAVPALGADIALIHVGQADCYGNGQHLGARFGDRLFARAADKVILTTERLVPNAMIRRNPLLTSAPYADTVVETPFGSHPYACHGFYKEDASHIEEYVRVSAAYRNGDEAPFRAYLDKYIYGPASHEEYLSLIDAGTLAELQRGVHEPKFL
jgi:glutaconate CoA-transferase subunit A